MSNDLIVLNFSVISLSSRETLVGEIIYVLSRGQLLSRPEDRPDFIIPEQCLRSTRRTPPHDSREEINDIKRLPPDPEAWPVNPKGGPGTTTGNNSTPLNNSRRHSRDETRTIAGDEMIPAMTEKGGKKSKEDSSEKFHSPSPPKQQQRETKIVTWYTDDDPENPLNWSSGKKAFVTACLCLLTFCESTYSCCILPSLNFIPRVPKI